MVFDRSISSENPYEETCKCKILASSDLFLKNLKADSIVVWNKLEEKKQLFSMFVFFGFSRQPLDSLSSSFGWFEMMKNFFFFTILTISSISVCHHRLLSLVNIGKAKRIATIYWCHTQSFFIEPFSTQFYDILSFLIGSCSRSHVWETQKKCNT